MKNLLSSVFVMLAAYQQKTNPRYLGASVLQVCSTIINSGVRLCSHTFHRTISVESAPQTIGTKDPAGKASPGDDAEAKM
ncbi:MAG TPA: hypothetical protein DCZ05_07550 [Deltaproteobacteria bacterium]|nr:hypothetical protein [Deltaproteobacteria bacterium]